MPQEKGKWNKGHAKMPAALWQRVGDIAKELRIGDKRGRHNAIIMEIVSAAVAKWEYSPYVCRGARHLAFVTSQGDVFYQLVQDLKLNSVRKRLPCAVEMKLEKRDEYAREYAKLSGPEGGSDDWFRRCWLINHFQIWKGWGTDVEPLKSGIDRLGTSSKMVDLPLPDLPGRPHLTREVIVGLRDYVQWKEPETPPETPRDDRIDFNVDIPTRDFQALVVVDEGLYSTLTSEEIPPLGIEFRNREWARFAGKDVVEFSEENRMNELHGQSSTAEEGDVGRVQSRLKEFLERLRTVAGLEVDSKPAVASKPDRDLVESLGVPERFLFVEIDWPSPHFGIEICVTFEKPVKEMVARARPTTAAVNKRWRTVQK
jgi:hypothetical protein